MTYTCSLCNAKSENEAAYVCMPGCPVGSGPWPAGRETPTDTKHWIGVDFDGTLATDAPDRSDPYQLGEPIPAMVARVQQWLREGIEVRIFTARMAEYSYTTKQWRDLRKMEDRLTEWCRIHIGKALRCTNQKDGLMLELWDDRARQVELNTGMPVVGTR
jgi:hypothetical protein